MAEMKLMDRVQQRIRLKGYSIRTEKTYMTWVKRFILFHNKRHPEQMGEKEIESYLTHLAMDLHVSPSTQNQALNASYLMHYPGSTETLKPNGGGSMCFLRKPYQPIHGQE